jgi:hypothetical protein
LIFKFFGEKRREEEEEEGDTRLLEHILLDIEMLLLLLRHPRSILDRREGSGHQAAVVVFVFVF